MSPNSGILALELLAVDIDDRAIVAENPQLEADELRNVGYVQAMTEICRDVLVPLVRTVSDGGRLAIAAVA